MGQFDTDRIRLKPLRNWLSYSTGRCFVENEWIPKVSISANTSVQHLDSTGVNKIIHNEHTKTESMIIYGDRIVKDFVCTCLSLSRSCEGQALNLL